MPNKPLDPDEIHEFNRTKVKVKAVGRIINGRRRVEIALSEPLFKQISNEAASRQWSFSHMVRFLCEASIDGIE